MDSRFQGLRHCLREAGEGLWRYPALTLLSTLSIAVTLYVFGLFILLALLSIYPTLVFAAWGKAMRRGEAPDFEPGRLRKVRAIVHTELAGIVLIVLFAAMMARGVGFFG